jgi:hypothetical protein
MAASFRDTMSSKSDSEVLNYVTQFHRFIPEAVELAILELSRRGRAIPDEQADSIRRQMMSTQGTSERAATEDREFLYHYASCEQATTNPTAPLLFGRGAIIFFSLFVGVPFGSALMAMNLAALGRRNDVAQVAIFGWVAAGITFALIQSGTVLSWFPAFLIPQLAGTCMLDMYFWRKRVGIETMFRIRSPRVPGVLAFILFTVFDELFVVRGDLSYPYVWIQLLGSALIFGSSSLFLVGWYFNASMILSAVVPILTTTPIHQIDLQVASSDFSNRRRAGIWKSSLFSVIGTAVAVIALAIIAIIFGVNKP